MLLAQGSILSLRLKKLRNGKQTARDDCGAMYILRFAGWFYVVFAKFFFHLDEFVLQSL